jgi:hypothetical protein
VGPAQVARTILLDAYAASHRADLTKLGSSKYRNNLIGQDHRNTLATLGKLHPKFGQLSWPRIPLPAHEQIGASLIHNLHQNPSRCE